MRFAGNAAGRGDLRQGNRGTDRQVFGLFRPPLNSQRCSGMPADCANVRLNDGAESRIPVLVPRLNDEAERRVWFLF